ncbi:hypothetical protein [Catellatospora sp. NPDC049609]|uniref:hypothetical protein n=1 Tax=Catellatospora sp. NPDC049609 TaxID=3155505 RepID=UPI00342650EF
MDSADDRQSALDRLRPELKLAAGLVPVVGPALAQYIDDHAERRRARIAAVGRSFSSESGADPENLLAVAAAHERLSDLVADVMESAQRTSSERKLAAFGRILASGFLAHDDAAVDELELIHAAVRDMEGGHLRVLDRLAQSGAGPTQSSAHHLGVPDYELAAMFPNGVVVVYAILKTLERHGIAGPMTPPSQDLDQSILWSIWDFGLLLHRTILKAS